MKAAVMITSEIAFQESPEASLAATFVFAHAFSAAAGSSLLPSRIFAKTYQSYQDRKSEEAVNALLSEESENHTALQAVSSV